MYELLKEFIKPELLVLVPVLYLVGVALKKSTVSDKKIPWILGTIGILLSWVWILASEPMTNWQGVLLGFFSGVTQGILIAGAGVFVNQLVKQAKKEE